MFKNLIKALLIVRIFLIFGAESANIGGNSYRYPLSPALSEFLLGKGQEYSKPTKHWQERVGNPCAIIGNYENTNPNNDFGSPDFYNRMIGDIQSALDTLDRVERNSANPDLCKRETIPLAPNLMDLQDLQWSKLKVHAYQSGIYLLANLEMMGMDRKVVGDQSEPWNPDDENLIRCGSETKDFPNLLRILILKIEDVLCGLFTETTYKERRDAALNLSNKEIIRHKVSCTLFEFRDCIVLRETRQTLTAFQNEFKRLTMEAKLVEGNFPENNYL